MLAKAVHSLRQRAKAIYGKTKPKGVMTTGDSTLNQNPPRLLNQPSKPK